MVDLEGVEIDKGFIDIIKYLNEKGMTTYACCDGILENHDKPSSVTDAYIGFVKSPKVLDLMAAFLRDPEHFRVAFTGRRATSYDRREDPEVAQNTYAVYFENKNGELTQYFERILHGVIEGDIQITDKERLKVEKIDEALEKFYDSDLYVSVVLNGKYQPYMNKDGKTNVVTVQSKQGILPSEIDPYEYEGDVEFAKDLTNLYLGIEETFGIPIKKDEPKTKYDESEFVASTEATTCEIYFSDEHLEHMLSGLEFIKGVATQLPMKEILEGDYEYYEDDSFWDENAIDDNDEHDDWEWDDD